MNPFAALALSLDRPYRLELRHPVTGAPLVDAAGQPAWIDVLSFDSEPGKAHDRMVTDARLKRRTQIRPTSAELEAELVDRLAAVTVGWRLLALDGSPIEADCTPQAARQLYATHAVGWIRDQVIEAAGTIANFAPATEPA